MNKIILNNIDFCAKIAINISEKPCMSFFTMCKQLLSCSGILRDITNDNEKLQVSVKKKYVYLLYQSIYFLS